MKKIVSIISSFFTLTALTVAGVLSAANGKLALATAPTLPHEGDLYGGAHVSFKATAQEDTLATLLLDKNNEGGSDFRGDGLFIRMKNNAAIDTYINFKLVCANGAKIGPKQGVYSTYISAAGTEVTYPSIVLRDYANYLILPASFNGYVYMDYATQMAKTDDSNSKTFNKGVVTAYFEISAKYDSYANFVIGDIFTNTTQVIDGSEQTMEQFSANFHNLSTDYLVVEQMPRSDNFEPRGDLLGSVNASTDGKYGGFRILADGASLDDGLFVRLRNNQNAVNYLVTHFNSRNGGRATNIKGAHYYMYNTEGTTSTEGTFTDVDSGYLTVPANFNGFLYLPLASYAHNTGFSATEFNKDDLYAAYFEGVMGSLNFGDVFTKTTQIYDGSEIYPDDLALHFAVDWDCTLTLNEGHLIPVIPEYAYGEVNYQGSLEGGVVITCTYSDNNDIAKVRINLPQATDFSSALAITVRLKAMGAAYPFFFRVVDSDNHISELPANTAEKKAKMVTLAGEVSNTTPGGNDHSIFYTTGFDGNLVIPLEVLSSYSGTADLTKIKAFEVGIAVHYDYNFKAAYGDIGYIVESTHQNVIVLDVSEGNFNTLFTKQEFPNFLSLDPYEQPKVCPWIGDVKILNTLLYPNDEAMKKEVTWNVGDNACTYHAQEDGMFVHIGPYELGHTYGSYMCLQLPEKGVTTDRLDWYKMVNGEKVWAKGITCYVKNLSRKEIGITLQFDEHTRVNTYERWCITGYPAMYYAWDVKTGAEYSYYCKSDQFQIPVGFEGYVRIPFESYRVPDWCQSTNGVDNVLDISRWSGVFYLTSDNTRFEDLEYLIKNVGVYFNETSRGDMFDQSHSIKTNMGLQEECL